MTRVSGVLGQKLGYDIDEEWCCGCWIM